MMRKREEQYNRSDKMAISITGLATNYIRSFMPKLSPRTSNHMWKNPPRGVVKVNVDTSSHADTLSKAIGVVLYDDRGDFIAAASWFIPHVRDVDAVELLAIRNGMFLLPNMGCNSTEVESDSSFVVESVNLVDKYLGPDAAVVVNVSSYLWISPSNLSNIVSEKRITWLTS